MKYRWKELIRNEEGMGVIEVVIIIVVLVGLALLFKTQITTIANGLFSHLRQQVSGI
ncbi:MAG: hypothetical protein K6G64_05835 [Eubacterium sp.]|nr:hypothetical protein [Eubacterium sp.]